MVVFLWWCGVFVVVFLWWCGGVCVVVWCFYVVIIKDCQQRLRKILLKLWLC